MIVEKRLSTYYFLTESKMRARTCTDDHKRLQKTPSADATRREAELNAQQLLKIPVGPPFREHGAGIG
jgi:hypothetical protein